MAIKHFDTDFFSEIIQGMSQSCEGLAVQQLLNAATQIYLAESSCATAEVKEGTWKEEVADGKSYVIKKIVECPFCHTRRGVFMGDTIDYCNGCGSKMVMR